MIAPVRGSSATTAPLRPARPSSAARCARRVERRAQVVAVGRRREHLVQQRAELAAVAHERLVVLLLQPGAAEADVAVADRVGEQPAGRVPARVGPVGALERPGEHRAVGGADRPAADPLLGEDLALVARCWPAGPRRRRRRCRTSWPRARRRAAGPRRTGGRSARSPHVLPAGAVGDHEQQREQDEVRDDRRAAVGDEGQRHAGQRDELRDAADDDEDLQAEDRRQPRRQQLGERVPGQRRGLEAALDDEEVDADDGGRADEPELVDDDRVDEVRLRGGQQRQRWPPAPVIVRVACPKPFPNSPPSACEKSDCATW